MKHKEICAYMDMAFIISTLSYCVKRQVGCVIVTPQNRIYTGYNGSPPGWDNCCEDHNNNTLSHIIHAEHNAIIKSTEPEKELNGAIVFVTYSPCIACAQLLLECNVGHIYYGTNPTKQEELDFLNNSGLKATYLPTR